jgi:large subunit ribosomal protein L18
MFKKRDRNEVRVIRHERVRKKISGTPARPRLSVYRSLNHIYAQIIDDSVGKLWWPRRPSRRSSRRP